ncbi:hypothetical protein CWO91_18910 [Bradyrhizobium genosp. SA-3]|nr:hypothetical protein CWO91_18910 [Bradyrhizobium genosp. SA-3]
MAHALSTSSLRAQRSNPESLRGKTLDCFVARASRNDGARGNGVVLQLRLSFPATGSRLWRAR